MKTTPPPSLGPHAAFHGRGGGEGARLARQRRATVAVLLLLLAMTLPLCSQETEQTSEQAPEQNPEEKPARHFDLRLGPFDFHPKLRTAATYDNNILFTSSGAESDLIYAVEPHLVIFGGDRLSLLTYYDQDVNVMNIDPNWIIIRPPEIWPNKFLVLDYAPRWQFFSNHNENNSTDQLLFFNMLWPVTKLVLGVQQDYQYEKTTIIEAGRRSEVERIDSELDAAYQFGEKTSADLRLSRSSVDYPGSTNLTGYVEWAAHAGLNYQVTPNVTVSLTTAGGYDDVGSGQNQQFVQFGGRVRYFYSDLLQFDASAGGEYRTFETGISSSLTPVFTLGADYQIAERTRLRVSGARRQYASVYNGTYYTSTGGNVTVRQGITDRVSATLDLLYYYFDYTATTAAQAPDPLDYYSAQLSVNVKIWKHLDGRVFYLYRGRGITTTLDVENQQTGIELTLAY